MFHAPRQSTSPVQPTLKRIRAAIAQSGARHSAPALICCIWIGEKGSRTPPERLSAGTGEAGSGRHSPLRFAGCWGARREERQNCYRRRWRLRQKHVWRSPGGFDRQLRPYPDAQRAGLCYRSSTQSPRDTRAPPRRMFPFLARRRITRSDDEERKSEAY
jgi:hypothetical protein